MKMQKLLKATALLLLFLAIGLQAGALLAVLFDLFTVGAVGFEAVAVYSGVIVFSIPIFIFAIVVIYGAQIRLPMRWICATYLGIHILSISLGIAFPGKFGQ